MKWRVRPSTISGTTMVPGDKSISHRALMIAALANGTSSIGNVSAGEDVASTINCLRELGAEIDNRAGTATVRGGRMREPSEILDAGNSGTTARLLSGILAGQSFTSVVTGDDSLRSRPMDRIAEPLERMGARVETAEGRLPLRLQGGSLRGLAYRPSVPSAQVKSCVLLAGLFAEGQTRVAESTPTRDHTERLLRYAKVPMATNHSVATVTGGTLPSPFRIDVPGDISSAAFLLTASVITGSPLTVREVGVNPTRTGFLCLLRRMGCQVTTAGESEQGGEPVADVSVFPARLRSIAIMEEEVPGCIDELPLVALLATAAHGTTTVRGAAELRAKESDRIAVVVRELHGLGADIRELPDGFVVQGPCRLTGRHCNSHGDHRIAMMLAVAGLMAEGETIVDGAEAAGVSYPTFAGTLKTLGADIHES